MCGRFTLLLTPELLAVVYEVSAPASQEPRYNIAPTQEVLVVREEPAGNRIIGPLRWGLVPHWAKEISIGSKLINARCETIHEKSSFRHAIRSRRCIIPASGYFEWAASSSGKLPHYITMRDESPMSLAGIWETWKAPDGKSLETVALLTTRANSMLAAIHDRMPVILHPGEFALWLDRTATDPHKLERLYQPFPSERIQAWPVSKAVNNAAHNSAECIQPLTVPP